MSPRNKQFSILPHPYKKKNSTKGYSKGTNQQNQTMQKKISEFAEV